MITPQEIAKRAERRYREILRTWLAGEDNFPIEFPVGRLSPNLIERRQQIDALRDSSKEMTGYGYEIEWQTINRRDLGKQTSPKRIIIASLDDYLAFTHKREEYDWFVADVELIRQQFPSLESWIHENPQDVIANHGQWDDLLLVCDYFCRQPRPNVYIRELPISVHTKFIEQNVRILRDLLDELLPPEWVNADETTFTKRFGLKEKAPLVRLRLLDEQLARQYTLFIDDISLPVDQCTHLLADHLRPRHIIIVENLINFLALPLLPDTVGLFGGGFAVHLLRDVSWLSKAHVIYWGDIDAHGFEILSDLRCLFPNVQSLMMDHATLDDNAEYVLSGNEMWAERYEGLTEAENRLALHAISHDLRLEQEHIPHAYAVTRLRRVVGYVD
jgi:hypothetical protein